MEEKEECLICREENGTVIDKHETICLLWCPSGRHQICKRDLPRIIETYGHCPLCFERFHLVDLLKKEPSVLIFDQHVIKKYLRSLWTHIWIRFFIFVIGIMIEIKRGVYDDLYIAFFVFLMAEIILQIPAEYNSRYWNGTFAITFTAGEAIGVVIRALCGFLMALLNASVVDLWVKSIFPDVGVILSTVIIMIVIAINRNHRLFILGSEHRTRLVVGPQISAQRLATIRYVQDYASTRRGWMSEATHFKLRAAFYELMEILTGYVGEKELLLNAMLILIYAYLIMPK